MRTFNNRAADVGRARARQLARWFGQELRIARVTAGLTQDRLAAIARVSQQEVSRVEAGADGPSLEISCRLAAAAGHQVRLGIVPVASVPLRDSGQMTVAEAILRVVHPAWTSTLEAQVAPGDRRAADMLLAHATERVQVEIERTIVDFRPSCARPSSNAMRSLPAIRGPCDSSSQCRTRAPPGGCSLTWMR